MNLKQILHNRKALTILSICLVISILLGLWIPGSSLNIVQPREPSPINQVAEMELLRLGDRNLENEQMDESEENSETGGLSKEEEKESEETIKEESEDTSEPEREDSKPKQEDSEPEQEDSEPEETDSEERQPEEKDPQDPGTGDGDDGQEEGLEGEEGGEEADFDIAMVMTWYKYGTQPKTIVCGPSDTVSGDINTAQLVNNELKYKFSLTGLKADEAKITEVSVKEGDASYVKISESGEITIFLPNASAGRDYTFQIKSIWKTKDAQGKDTEQELVFTYVIHCAYALDLELELSWEQNIDQRGRVICAANKNAAKTIQSNKLSENMFVYSPKLVGALAGNARLISGEYQTASGTSGTLNVEGGTLALQAASGAEKETYYLTFEAQITEADGAVQNVYYHVTIVFVETLDIELSFTWLEKGTTPRMMNCQPNDKVSMDIKNNQLSAGAVKYEMELIGADSENVRILNISYTSEWTGGGGLEASGALPVSLPAGYTSNTYTILVVVLSGGKQINYEVVLRYSMDVSLEMTYAVKENGISSTRTILCENGKTKTAEAIYDDQLNNGKLSYQMVMTGTETLAITSVSCYQSGSGSTVSLEPQDELMLLLKEGKTGENTFTVTAEDNNGTTYEFRINVPYKHRGENNIKITTNMVDGQVVVNETSTNLNIRAWSEDEAGNVVSYIPANGTDTKLIVKLDGETLSYVSTSGPASEYILYPGNPVTGDTNEHTLYIYAEDAYGNYGELTLILKGQRNQAGQKKGTATIYIDLTAMGLGVVDSVSYDVLADEPISYSIVKAVLGEDTGDPFGASANTLGWNGTYAGTLDTGFYLESLTPGLSGNTLNGSSWNQYGSNEQEILQAIDDRFGAGTGLATLWRCLYRNGLNKSSGTDGTYGEFDFTSGSGWLYSLNGTYYPGLSMSEYSLEDGDVLTLRYTLAHGWDVGGGTPGYGNTIGYCVTALNGSYYINHQMETVEHEDGSLTYMCRCCGLVEGCAHVNMISQNLGDGTHVAYCEDCKTTIGDPELHIWECTDDAHTCSACGASEAHNWKEVEGSNTATCTEGGIRIVSCTTCAMTREEESPANGHKLNNRWNHTNTEHYQKCSICDEIIAESQGMHEYVYHAGDDDWYCIVCEAGHDWDYCGNANLIIDFANCRKIIYFCNECGLYLKKEGSFPEYHYFENGSCIECGEADPNYIPSEPEDEDVVPES